MSMNVVLYSGADTKLHEEAKLSARRTGDAGGSAVTEAP
jgi:hypothetical protein